MQLRAAGVAGSLGGPVLWDLLVSVVVSGGFGVLWATASQLHSAWLRMLAGGINGGLLHCTVLGGRHGLVNLLWAQLLF
jgi:hypothetical protein